MDKSWFDRCVDAWLLHPQGGAPDGTSKLKALLECCSTDVRYEDVPTATVFEEHDGTARMCEGAYKWSSDIEAAVVTRQTDGTLFAIETGWRGSNTTLIGDLPATGPKLMLRDLSIESNDDQRLVKEHRDYWDLAGFLAQVRARPPAK